MKDKLEAQELLEQRELTEEEVFSGSRRFAGSPTTTTRSWTRRERNVPEGEDPNTPLMYAMSQQIKDLHLVGVFLLFNFSHELTPWTGHAPRPPGDQE